MSRIEIQNLCRDFKGTRVLQEVNLTLGSGLIYGLVGRNGSGKTVLMKLICGFLAPTQGRVLIDGKQVGKDVDFAPNTGAIIEIPAFLSYLSGYQNLKNLADIQKKIGPAEIRQVMEQVGLDPDSKKRVGKYSLGMRQRLGIAQAIMEDPDILILDEPMNGLDKQGVAEMKLLFLQLKERGKLILLASHIQADVEFLCDEIFELEQGVLSSFQKRV